MKYTLLSLGAAAAVLVFVSVMSFPTVKVAQRVHQHRESPPPTACVPVEGTFSSHLPLVSIQTGGQELTLSAAPAPGGREHITSNQITGTLQVYDSGTGNNHLTDQPAFVTSAKFKYRGNTSILFDKKSYKVDFVEADGTERDSTFLGMPAHDEWVLNGPFLDKTLLRNYLGLNIAGEIMPDTPEVRLCELFEDGVYKGLYLAMEKVERSEDRVELSLHQPENPYTSYLLRQDRNIGQEGIVPVFSSYALKIARTNVLEVEYPSVASLTPTLIEYIANDFSLFEKTLYSFDYDDPRIGYRSLIDTESFVDYFIINEFFGNYDAGIFSTFFYKDLRGKLHIGPVWDFNNSCDNFMSVTLAPEGFQMPHYPRYNMLFKDERFVEQVIARYKVLRKTTLSEAYLLAYVEDSRAYLGDAVARNNEVWGYSFDPLQVDTVERLTPIERNPRDYEQAITQLKDYLQQRGTWMDAHIEILRQFAHESKNKKFNH